MKIELLDSLIQINIDNKDSYSIHRAKTFAEKYFSKSLKLYSSIIILDSEKERIKKRYFLNWALNYSDKKCKKTENSLTENRNLPIRIKFTDNKGLLEHIKIKVEFLSENRVAFRLDKPNRLARRYLISKFKDYVIGFGKAEVFVRNSNPLFWRELLDSLRQKVIYNVSIEFLYDKFEAQSSFETLSSSFLTEDERKFKKSLKVLNCRFDDSFESIKNRYLELAREYHPDNVYGQEQEIIDLYISKFRTIKEAYDIVKKSLKKAA